MVKDLKGVSGEGLVEGVKKKLVVEEKGGEM